MPRVLVMTDTGALTLMDERVLPIHLEDEHTSLQVLERLAWAISDASEIEQNSELGRARMRKQRADDQRKRRRLAERELASEHERRERLERTREVLRARDQRLQAP